jgi:hypothetical protein
LWLLPLARQVAAQVDYRNLDDDRPVLTEDAYPVERYAFELVAPYRFEREAEGAELHTLVPEIAYGVIRNAQVGLKLPLAVVDAGSGTEWGLAGVRMFGLYNLNTESARLPALSIRADLSLPFGSLAGQDARWALKAIATRSWGRIRAHLNVSRGFGPADELAVTEALPRWSTSLALDWTLIRSSLLVIGEIAGTELVRDAPTALNASLGGRWQWTPTVVLDLGVTRRLRSRVGPDIAVTVGLSHAFAIRSLMPSGPQSETQ